jgi:cholest-4-en-3-one 26-monooxygenase
MIGSQDSEYGSGVPAEEAGSEYGNVVMEMAIYAHELSDEKRRTPTDDVWTRLTEARVTLDDGTVAELTDLERDLFFALLVVAGNETTRNAISKGLIAFMEHRDQWDRFIAHPELADTMVEEILRYTSPVNFFRRTATADTELGGQKIKAGEKVVLWYPSANRDPAEFGPTADDFDIARDPNHHVAFGGGGPHFCLGANLARLEIKMMFQELARRVPDIELAGPAQRLRMNLVDAIKHQPVRFTPSPAEN